MPTENINIETQVQVDITRAALQALIAANTVKKKLYHVTDAIGGTQKILVWSLTNSTTSFNAVNFTNGKFGRYYIGPDVFVAIVEGMGGVLSYNSFAVFPTTGLQNTVYIDLATNEQYYWNGSSYELLSGGNVYEPTVDDFPMIGSVDTLYVATETGVMYLWDNTDEVYVALNSNGDYIPRSGTETGNPVYGNVQMGDELKFYSGDIDGEHWGVIFGVEYITLFNSTSGFYTELALMPDQFVINSDHPTFAGIVDTEERTNPSSLINLATMKSRIWTKAGTPTTTDDINEGYLVGSLIWDTTNSILYKCTDNTASAATWDEAIQSNVTLYDTIRLGATVPASSTRYACVGLSGLSSSVVLNIAPPELHTDFRIVLGTAQPASGTLVVERVFTDYSGTLLHTDTLTIPAGSGVGEYIFTGATYDASGGANMRFAITNNAAASSAFIQGIENQYS